MPSGACSGQLSHAGLFLIAAAFRSRSRRRQPPLGIHQSPELTCGSARLSCLSHAAGGGINSATPWCYSDTDRAELFFFFTAELNFPFYKQWASVVRCWGFISCLFATSSCSRVCLTVQTFPPSVYSFISGPFIRLDLVSFNAKLSWSDPGLHHAAVKPCFSFFFPF